MCSPKPLGPCGCTVLTFHVRRVKRGEASPGHPPTPMRRVGCFPSSVLCKPLPGRASAQSSPGYLLLGGRDREHGSQSTTFGLNTQLELNQEVR